MNRKHYLLISAIATSAIYLQGCSMIDEPSQDYQQYSPPPAAATNIYNGTAPEYHGNYAGGGDGNSAQTPQPKKVKVPESALLSESGPQLHHDVDQSWVSKQKPEEYTIKLISDEKATTVAKTLYNAPKNERTAEVKSLKEGKPTYTGVYGSFNNKESAEKALQNLPQDIREKASINQWSQVQEQIKPNNPQASDANTNTSTAQNNKSSTEQ